MRQAGYQRGVKSLVTGLCAGPKRCVGRFRSIHRKEPTQDSRTVNIAAHPGPWCVVTPSEDPIEQGVHMRRLPPAILATAITAGVLLAAPSAAYAQLDPCQAGFVLLPSSVLCTPQPSPAAAQPAPQPTPQRSLLDRVLGRNKPAPTSPAPAAAPPAAPAPVAPPPTTAAPAPPAAPPALIPLVILPSPGTPLPTPSERTVWLHTCVDLYVANNHLVQIDNQQLDVPDLAYVLFQCSATPGVVPVVPGVVVPGQPPSAGSETVSTHLPVTG